MHGIFGFGLVLMNHRIISDRSPLFPIPCPLLMLTAFLSRIAWGNELTTFICCSVNPLIFNPVKSMWSVMNSAG